MSKTANNVERVFLSSFCTHFFIRRDHMALLPSKVIIMLKMHYFFQQRVMLEDFA